jgi:hypothetical protein
MSAFSLLASSGNLKPKPQTLSTLFTLDCSARLAGLSGIATGSSLKPPNAEQIMFSKSLGRAVPP